VLSRSQLIFPSKTWFFGIYLNFQRQKSLKNSTSHILNSNLTKQIPLNPAHQDLSNNTKGTFQFLQKFQLWFNLVFSEEIILYPRIFAEQVHKRHEKKAHAPRLIIESFQKTPRTISEASWFSGSHNYKTKQNKLPSFIDRWQGRSVTHPLLSGVRQWRRMQTKKGPAVTVFTSSRLHCST
jgi:hypothetical protein